MKNIIEVIKANGGNILKKGAFATVVIAGITIASKTIFAKGSDEDDYGIDTATINDDDEDSDEE